MPGIFDHRVVHLHGERAVIDDLDLRAGTGDDVAVEEARADPCLLTCVGLDEHRSRGRVDVRQLDEEDIQLLLHQRLPVNRLDQAERHERVVDQLELHLIARDGFGIRAVAFDPRQYLVALLEQHVAEVAVNERRRVQIDRLDDVELVVQRGTQRARDVAGINDGVLAGCRGRRAEVLPAQRIAVVLALEHDVHRAVRDRQEFVVMPDDAADTGARHPLNDRAGVEVERNLVEVQARVLVCNVGRQA